MNCSSFFAAVAIVLLASECRAEETLPKSLMLECSGKYTSMRIIQGINRGPQWGEGDFKITVELKDKVMTDVTNDQIMGKNCFLESGTVACQMDETVFNELHNVTQRQQRVLMLTRDTGALKSLNTDWTFIGRKSSGLPGGTEKVQRTGTCHPIRKTPLF
ncbi:hypothetical protein RLW55_16795 [Hyphomicrobium sp. B1]|uniref:hypothetical protein n=1 Tax=Hyphomicrobium sp. B1 TaxID=3075651 RepID=UPI003C2BE599